MSKIFDIVFTATPEQVFRFDENRFMRKIEDRMTLLLDRLRGKIARNLHGDVLQSRTGRLAASLSAVNVYREGDTITGELEVGRDVPYALTHEHGGAGPYEIVATDKRVLKMLLDQKATFRKMVTHKAALKRSFFLSAIDGMEDEFLEELTSAVGEGLSGE